MSVMSTDVTSRTRFRSWRLAKGLSQEEVADLIGCGQPEVSAIESGRRRALRPMTKVLIARRLGARVRDLFETEELLRTPGDEEATG